MLPTLLTPAYFPPLLWMACLAQSPQAVLEVHGHYEKQSWRNRFRLLTDQGPLDLSIPITKGEGKVPLHAVEIDSSKRWAEVHQGALQAAYGQAPYWEYYGYRILDILATPPASLLGLQLTILERLCQYWQLPGNYVVSDHYITDNEIFTDLRETFHPKKPEPPCQVPPYRRVFGQEFVPGLTVLDLLFCLGPQQGRQWLTSHLPLLLEKPGE